MNKNLKNLAMLKIKKDLYTELYEKEKEELKTQMIETKDHTIIDTENNLTLKLKPKNNRTFNIELIKKLGGQKCIEEKVDTKEFDKFIKENPEAKDCAKIIPTYEVAWDGINTLKEKFNA